MLTFGFRHTRPAMSHVLCLGAHADDIEIGCGGTILTLLEAEPSLAVTWVVFSAAGPRAEEARQSAASFLAAAAGRTVVVHDFRDGFFPYTGAPIKEQFEELKARVSPDLVFTHYRHDLHQDHRVLSELTRNTFRDHAILEYEIPKYDGDLGQPNVFVPLETGVCHRKVEILLSSFATQRAKRWFTDDLFRAHLRLRGMECNSPSTYAEAFHGHKLVLGS
jgi:LmbE family N-acetylglucosaminyl deacetylase